MVVVGARRSGCSHRRIVLSFLLQFSGVHESSERCDHGRAGSKKQKGTQYTTHISFLAFTVLDVRFWEWPVSPARFASGWLSRSPRSFRFPTIRRARC